MSIGNIQLLDLIEKDVLEEIVRDFTKATRVAAVLVDLSGQPITREHNFTRLCKICRSTPEGRARCYASDRFGGEEGKKIKNPFIYKCLNAGLMDSATPIVVEGYHVATLVMGQVLTNPLPIDEAVDNARRIGIEDMAGYIRALHEVPFMSYQRLQAAVKLMNTIANTISSLAIQKYLSQKAYQKNLHNIINSVSEAIVSTDQDGVIRLINRATLEMFGRDSSAIVGQPVYDLFADPDAFRRYLMSKKGQDPFEVPPVFEFLRADGRLFSAQVSFQKIYLRKQEFLGYVAVLRDVTQEKKVEKMKEDLIGMLTHDMSNPILSIQRVLEMLLDGHLGSLNASGSDLVPLALDCTNNLSGMVSNFLDIFLDECAGLNLCGVPGDMDTALAESLRLVELPAGDKDISLHFRPGRAGICFPADWSRLRRTCVNLLQNAIRFSPKGGAIFIDARVLAGGNTTEEGAETRRRVQVTIEDQGTGISPQNQALIFEKFYTTSTRGDRTRRGVGLGLTFSKLVIEAHKGRIGVESPYRSENGAIVSGCRFRFDIPVANDDVYAVEGAEHDG